MAIERYLWWVGMAWAFSYAWRAYHRSTAAKPQDTSGTLLLQRAVAAIDAKRSVVGATGLIVPGHISIIHIVTVQVNSRNFRLTMEEVHD